MRNLPRINVARIKKTAQLIRELEIEKPLNFYSIVNGSGHEIVFHDTYPPLHAPGVVDFFFFAMIHNYGFWHDDGEKYTTPLHGKWGGKDAKGSDLLWKMLRKALLVDDMAFTPEKLEYISDEQFARIFSDDNGRVEFFNTEERRGLTRAYGRWFRTMRMAGQTPSELVNYANEYINPASALRQILIHPENGVPGYHEDPLGKKTELLIMALVNRTERILRKSRHAEFFPIVDYHDMRLTLRLGHVILPKDWVLENEERRITSPEREEAIRRTTYRADLMLIALSGKTRDEIDMLKWSARRYCPEMTPPNCSACLLQSVCAKRTRLFQPVFRTTFY